jgi:hypothetical protein
MIVKPDLVAPGNKIKDKRDTEDSNPLSKPQLENHSPAFALRAGEWFSVRLTAARQSD